ncbi:MAG: hypothetical protein FJW39_23880 [Acidobacteria bacterium]|nr:hypothetical protein [Acidobacteriota bacterium]
MKLAALVLLAAVCAAQEYRAFWADAFHSGFKSPAEVEKLVEDAAASHANAIFIQARRRGDSYYLNTREVPAQDTAYSPSFDALQFLIDRAHARGIEVHAWFIVYPLWPSTIAPPTNPDHVWHRHGPRAQGSDMWMAVSSTGTISSAFDPGHPGVQAYLADVITDPVDKYDIDGVHLDYIRYNEDAPYGWNPVAVDRFGRLENRTARPVQNDPVWSDFRRRQVTQLVREIYLRTVAKKPKVKVSAALISWGNGPLTDAAWRVSDPFATVFQDWRSWMEEGILDLAMPMHYFRETTNAAFLDRWINFAKDRQFNRRYLPGLAPYLNSIPDSLNQIRRALPAGAGVCLYSYASTNTLNAAGNPITPNENFYSAVGELFGGPAAVPELPWKKSPATGHLMGRLSVDGGPAWLADGARVVIESDTGAEIARSTVTSATGFFGFVDLPRDRYRIRLERGGQLLFRAVPQEVRAGIVTEVPVRMQAADFAALLPRLTRALEAAPGDLVVIEGLNLSAGVFAAQSVPLPAALGLTQIVVNGVAAPVFSVEPDRAVVQFPYDRSGNWNVIARHAGMESGPVQFSYVETHPVILGTNRAGRYLEIYATGLGATGPMAEAGRGADPTVGLPLVSAPVKVMVNGSELDPLFAGLSPYHPGRYQVNIELPEGTSAGTVRIRAGAAISPEFRF